MNERRLQLSANTKEELTNTLERLRIDEFPSDYFANPLKVHESIAGRIAFLCSIEPTAGRRLDSVFKAINWPYEYQRTT